MRQIKEEYTCDLCGKPIPIKPIQFEQFCVLQPFGIQVKHVHDDLCQDCARKLREFLYEMREGVADVTTD